MERAAGAIGLQFAQVQRLLNDPLARKGRVAVNQDHHAVLAGLVRGPVLPGPHAADRHWIHKLQMARVEAEREVHAPAVGGTIVGGVAEVILHVATADVQLRIHVGKLAEDPLRTLSHDVREHVETAAMRHRQHDVADILRSRPLDRHLHQRDQTLRSLEREALGAEKPLLNELLEDRRGGHLPVDPQLLLAVELDAVFTPLHPHLQPLPHPQVVHVHELHADRPAVGVAEPLDDLPQRHRLRPLDRVGGERPIHVGFGEVVELRIELRQPRPRPAQRIDLGHQVAAHAVGPHELVDAILQEGHPLFARRPRCHRQRQRHRLTGRRVWQSHVAVGDRHGMPRGDAIGCHELGDRLRGRRRMMGRAIRDCDGRSRIRTRNLVGTVRCSRNGCRGHRPRSHRVEVAPPFGIHAGRVVLILLEEFLEKGEVCGSRRIDTVGRTHWWPCRSWRSGRGFEIEVGDRRQCAVLTLLSPRFTLPRFTLPRFTLPRFTLPGAAVPDSPDTR